MPHYSSDSDRNLNSVNASADHAARPANGFNPTANLAEQLELSRKLLNMRCLTDDDAEEHGLMAERLAGLVEALTAWLESGGSLPDAWAR